MKRVLAIDTSSWWGGAALVEQRVPSDTALVAEIGVRVSDSHAGRAIGWVEWLLDQAGWSSSDVDAYVAIRGPGSFTGIRVGLGTVRGLALAADRPCLGVHTLEAIAEDHGPAEVDRIPLIPAGRGEVYGARYDAASSPPVEKKPPWLAPMHPALVDEPAPGMLIWSGGVVIPEELPALPVGLSIGRRARHVAAAAGRLALLRGLEADPNLSPLYLRPPDAELKPRER